MPPRNPQKIPIPFVFSRAQCQFLVRFADDEPDDQRRPSYLSCVSAIADEFPCQSSLSLFTGDTRHGGAP